MNDLVSSDNEYEIGSGIPGILYIAYREGNGPLTIDLTGVDGVFQVSYYNPFNGTRFDRVGKVEGGEPVTLEPPFEHDDVVVLLLKE